MIKFEHITYPISEKRLPITSYILGVSPYNIKGRDNTCDCLKRISNLIKEIRMN